MAAIDDILAKLAGYAEFSTWGEPSNRSLLLRQEQPAGTGSSQYKCEDLPFGTGTLLVRQSDDILATAITALDEEASPEATDWILLQKADGTFKKVSAASLGLTAQETRDAMKLAPTGGAAAAGSVDEHLDDILSSVYIAASTADSGTTTTLVDVALTQGNDYWNGALLRITSGSITGQTRRIVDFDAGTNTMTVDPAFTAAVSTNTYIVLPGALTGLLTATQATIDAIPTAADVNAECDTAISDASLPTAAQVVTAMMANATDGVTLTSILECVMAALFGEATVSGSDVVFKKRDGSTTKLTVTVGANAGERDASVIA